jgi:hypothetical protein
MNQKRGWENEATSRAVNAEPWEPTPGMVKRQCDWCRYFSPRPQTATSRAAPIACKPVTHPRFAGADLLRRLLQ